VRRERGSSGGSWRGSASWRCMSAARAAYNARRVMGPGPRAPAPAEASGARHHAAARRPQRPGRLRLHAKEHPHNAARGTTARYSARFGTALQHCSPMPRGRGSATPFLPPSRLRAFMPCVLAPCLHHTPPWKLIHLLVQDHISPQPPHPLSLGSHARGHAVSAAIFQEQPRGQAEGNLRPIHSQRTASR
jgi:hypothetical protein